MNSNPKQADRIREARAAAHRSDDGEAFLPDPTGKHNPLTDTDGESFAEEFIASALAGEPVDADAADEVVDEEWGGPFLEVEAVEADITDAIPEAPGLHQLPPRLH